MKTSALKTSKFTINGIELLLYVGYIIIPFIIYDYVNRYSNDPQFNFQYLNIETKVKMHIVYAIPVLILVCILLALGISIMKKLHSFLISVEAGNYFNSRNVEFFNSIAKKMKIVTILYVITTLIYNLGLGRLNISISTTLISFILISALAHVMADIFKHGVQIQEEQDLTV